MRPQLWIERQAAASWSSFVVMMPPSPQVRFLLDWNENDARCPRQPGGPVLVARPVGVGGVLDDEQLVLPRDGHDGVHVGRLAGEVDRDDGAGARRDGGLDRLRDRG